MQNVGGEVERTDYVSQRRLPEIFEAGL
ncbi:hypothetical protein SAMN05421798_1781, partial [Pseudovibrio axinellae]